MIGFHLDLFGNLFKMKKTVIVQFEIEGFHHYPNAPKEVIFLAHNHRHTFKIKCGYEVSDMNREKEIFIQINIVKKHLIDTFGTPCYFNAMSCEMIAHDIMKEFKQDNMIWCEVWEEETGGAKVEL
tara:strand:- start:5558 stop:5935 length:378 start_codon:yes stop_codon:yes gene_type:complete